MKPQPRRLLTLGLLLALPVFAQASDRWEIPVQTRTLDKYLSLDTLPKAPRWKTVVATAEYVLNHGPLNDTQRQLVFKVLKRWLDDRFAA